MADAKAGDEFEGLRASKDRRLASDPSYAGPERRSGKERRKTPRVRG